MKLSTKVKLANSLAKEKGGRPVLTMNELWNILRPLKARDTATMRKLIAEKLWNY